MPRFHISARGEAATCQASVRGCPLGGENIHGNFDSPQAAQAWAESKLASQYGGSFTSEPVYKFDGSDANKYVYSAGWLRAAVKQAHTPAVAQAIEEFKAHYAQDAGRTLDNFQHIEIDDVLQQHEAKKQRQAARAQNPTLNPQAFLSTSNDANAIKQAVQRLKAVDAFDEKAQHSLLTNPQAPAESLREVPLRGISVNNYLALANHPNNYMAGTAFKKEAKANSLHWSYQQHRTYEDKIHNGTFTAEDYRELKADTTSPDPANPFAQGLGKDLLLKLRSTGWRLPQAS